MVPLRAIDESYIQDEEIDKAIDEKYLDRRKLEKKEEDKKLGKLSYVAKTELIPLGPIIKTPVLTIKHLTSLDERKRKSVSKTKEIAPSVKKTLRDAEKLLFKLIFPNFRPDLQVNPFFNNYKNIIKNYAELCSPKD